MPNNTASKRVLIVDDDLDSCELMVQVLVQRGYEASYVADGPGALRAFLAQPPDVLLLDVGLPGMDGHEVAQRIRELPSGRDVRIVVLSGYDRAKADPEGAPTPFDHYLVKPVNLDQLARVIGMAASDDADPKLR
jgi:CheY-like chemotaxis protein